MRCDSIDLEAIDPVAGKIEISGWAAAAEGIERVEVRVGDAAPLPVRYGIERGDIGELLSDIKGAGMSGFAAAFDTRDLPHTLFPLKNTAPPPKKRHRELDLPLIINQEIGVLGEY